jgi:hypothetical protein
MTHALPIYIGFDEREAVAYHVFANSIIRHASRPVQIIPLVQSQLRKAGLYTRPENEPAATAFAFSRFLVPHLAGIGYAVFADCDMLMQADIHELIDEIDATRTPYEKVWCCKHDYTPKSAVKMDGQPQVTYPRKNWSSFMVFDAARCLRKLDANYVNNATGAQLHRFEWISDDELGSIPLEWNWLAGEYIPKAQVKNIHLTNGGPWFPGYEDCDYAAEWNAERDLMLGKLPVAA